MINGNTISLIASLDALGGVSRFAFFTDVGPRDPGAFDRTTPVTVDIPTDPPFEEDLSDISEAAPARGVIYEEFYYPDVPALKARSTEATQDGAVLQER